METSDDDILADRVDTEPAIFKGCSSTELMLLLVASVACWIPVSLVIALAFGRASMTLGILAVGVLATVFFGAKVFQKIKRNRPDHYYVHALARVLHLRKLRTAPFVWRSGLWDIGRN